MTETRGERTPDRQMEMMYNGQQEVIAFLRAIGDPDLADRLERSAAVRRERCAAMVSRSPVDLPLAYGAEER